MAEWSLKIFIQFGGSIRDFATGLLTGFALFNIFINNLDERVEKLFVKWQMTLN